MGTYPKPMSSFWPRSKIKPRACVALAEIINWPTNFTSHAPYYVVQHEDWIIW